MRGRGTTRFKPAVMSWFAQRILPKAILMTEIRCRSALCRELRKRSAAIARLSGDLVRPLGDTQVRTNSGYYLLTHQDRAPIGDQQAVEHWLLDQSAARKRYGPAPGQVSR